MLKTKVLILDIDNLTEARYFAAWGVDMICFRLQDELSTEKQISKLVDLCSWVEGPELALQITATQSNEFIFELTNKSPIKSLIAEQFNIDLLEQFPNLKYYQITEKDIKNIANTRECFHKIRTKQSLEEQLAMDVYGVTFLGTGEEKVGLKDFEILDEYFEILETH